MKKSSKVHVPAKSARKKKIKKSLVFDSSSDDDEQVNDENDASVANISPRTRKTNMRVEKTPVKSKKSKNCSKGSSKGAKDQPTMAAGEAELELRENLCPDAVFNYVKNAFHLKTVPSKILGRKQQIGEINTFLAKHLTEQRGGSMYICGAPGTGKSLSISTVRRALIGKDTKIRVQATSSTTSSSSTASKATLSSVSSTSLSSSAYSCGFKTIYFNAMPLTSPKLVYTALLELVSNRPQDKGLSPVAAAERLQEIFIAPSKKGKASNEMTVVFVDEIDSLLGKAQAVLYRLFEWPKKFGSRLILVGIANSMDMTERFLPRLRARSCAPPVMIFSPYRQTELFDILCQRLVDVEQTFKRVCDEMVDQDGGEEGDAERKADDHAMHKKGKPRKMLCYDTMALEFTARKVAAVSGDVRKCFSIARQCLDIARPTGTSPSTFTSPSSLSSSSSSSSSPSSPTSAMLMESLPNVGFGHVARVIRSSLGSQTVDRIKTIPRMQQILLVIAVLADTKQKTYTTIAKLKTDYLIFTKKLGVPTVDASDIDDMVSSLNVLGFLSPITRNNRFGRIGGVCTKYVQNSQSKFQEFNVNVKLTDVAFALSDIAFFESLIKRGKNLMGIYDAE